MKNAVVTVNDGSGNTYELYAELIPSGKDHDCLRFSSVWTGAKRPEDEQRKFEVFLTEKSKLKLINLLSSKVFK